MDKVFKALANETRRRLLDRLFETPGLTLSELTTGLGLRRQTVTQHLHTLEEANLLVCHWRGREKLHYLNPLPIAEASHRWIDKYSHSKTAAIVSLRRAAEDKERDQ
jgi:DNA-binding transcriptional ArsR family regulator